MERSKSKGLVTILILLAALAGFVFLGFKSLKSIRKNYLGLDLSGGASITYQAEGDPTDEEMDDTVYKLQQRVSNYSTEAQVSKELGSKRIRIDIPGISSDQADKILTELGQPGTLSFQDPSGNEIISGAMVKSAKDVSGKDSTTGASTYSVVLTFNDEGTKAFGDATTKLVQQRIAIIYDGKMISNPIVNEPITGGTCYIEGMQSAQEAKDLASSIRIGSLKVPLTEVQMSMVGAQLGQSAITTSYHAGLVGCIAVAVFMLIIYWLPGLAAALALALYAALTVCLVRAFHITLTLPGIAGIILSVGMAVDANVIIFTRIREEIGNGKTVRSAVKTGFHKALSAIIDGNVTTLIAAAVLNFMGTGTIKGFAQTLALGVVVSMFTAIFITRAWLNAFCNIGLDQEKLFGSIGERNTIDFVGKKKVFFGLAIAAIASGFIGMAVWGAKTGSPLNFGLDFKGGSSMTITFDKDVSLDEFDSNIKPVIYGVTNDNNIQAAKVQGTNQITVKTRELDDTEMANMKAALAASDYKVDTNNIQYDRISGVISSEMRKNAMLAVVISLILMLIYIAIRFSDIRFAVSAILCLCHDVLVLFACYVLFRWSVDSSFIACMLTLVGYSINDTIVVFDRIRENGNVHRDWTREELANRSVTETFSRSLFTSLTTFMTIFVLFLMGVASIRDFTLPLMVGTICGTYSSIAIATPLWYLMERHHDKKKAAVRVAEENKKEAERAAKKAAKSKTADSAKKSK